HTRPALVPYTTLFRSFGIAVHDRPMPSAGQPIGNDGGEIAKDAVLDQGELVEPGAEVPVGAGIPEAVDRLAEEPRVKAGEPSECGIEEIVVRLTRTPGVPGRIQILEDEHPLTVACASARRQERRHAAGVVASRGGGPIERRLDVERAPLPVG